MKTTWPIRAQTEATLLMYLADLLNSRGLFQRCATWMESREYGEQIESLLSRATGAVVGILRMEELQRRCLWEFDLFDDQIADGEDRVVFNSSSMIALQNEVSPLLSNLRIMQDEINGLVRKQLGGTLPRSINATMKKLDSLGMSVELAGLYQRYWSSSGRKIRDYRVLDQHYATVVPHVFLQLFPSRRVLLFFPDNPQVQSKSRFTYDAEVCGISLLRVGFDALHEFIEEVAAEFGFAPMKLNRTIQMGQLGDLRPFRKRTLGLLWESSIGQPSFEGMTEVRVSGIRFGQLEDGTLDVQRMVPSRDKLAKVNRQIAGEDPRSGADIEHEGNE